MAEKKYFDENGLLYYDTIVKGRLEKKVDKEFKTGSSSEYKVLSDNNLTDELKQKILDAGTGSFTGNYDDLMGIPTLDGTQLKGTLTKKELDIASAYALLQAEGDIANAMADIEEMQQAGYQTASDVEGILSSKNYATEIFVTSKGYQTSSEVEQAIASKGYATTEWVQSQNYQDEDEVQALIDDAIKDVTQFDYEVVDNLPPTGKKGVIYLVPNKGTGKNIKDEYIWVESLNDFEKIGTTDVDLSGYVKEEDLVPISNEEIERIVNPS